jgi:hypothetical protein
VRQGRIAVPATAHLDDIVEHHEAAKGSDPSVQSFLGGNVRRVKVQGQFGSDAVVPYNISVFGNLKVAAGKQKERESDNVSIESST